MITRRNVLIAGVSAPLLAIGEAGMASEPSWSAAASLPLSTQEIYPAAHDGSIYVAGGIAARMGVPYFTDRVVRYAPGEDEWHEAPALPEALHHTALASFQGALIAVGGFNGGYTHVWRMRDQVYQLVDEQWQAIAPLPKPLAEGVLAVRPGGALHLVSGQTQNGEANSERSDHREVTDHWVLDELGGQWRTAAPIPTARNSATGGWIGDYLVVAGGRTAAGNLAVTEIYDAQKDVWFSGAPMPLPQAGTASVVDGQTLLVFGGEIFVPEARVFPNAWRYHLAEDKWTALPDMPTPRHGLGAVRVDQRVFVVGGATKPGGRGTSDLNEILTLSGA